MSTEWMTWIVIAAACLISNAFRYAPLLLLKTSVLDLPWMQRFLEYASFAVIGGIIGQASLRRPADAPLQALFTESNLSAALTVLIVFLIAARWRRPLPCLLAGIVVYVVLRAIMQWT